MPKNSQINEYSDKGILAMPEDKSSPATWLKWKKSVIILECKVYVLLKKVALLYVCTHVDYPTCWVASHSQALKCCGN